MTTLRIIGALVLLAYVVYVVTSRFGRRFNPGGSRPIRRRR